MRTVRALLGSPRGEPSRTGLRHKPHEGESDMHGVAGLICAAHRSAPARLRSGGVLAALGLFLLLPALARAETVVTLGFDDTLADQYQVADILKPHGIEATFFVNSPRIGAGSSYMTLAQ